MTVNDSVGRGDMIQYETESTTIAIAAGLVVGLDSSGDVTLGDATDAPIGVTATAVRARTTASQEKITVQVSGMAHVTCAANEAFDFNDFVGGGTEGAATTLATLGTTCEVSAALKTVIGRVITQDATTEGTTVVVRVGIC